MKSPDSNYPVANSPQFKEAEAGNFPTLPLSFFLQPTEIVAKKLLGKGLFAHGMLAEIVETEAYFGDTDPASHAYRGLSKRNWPMFEAGGICYVYLSYGINYCMNVVTGPTTRAEAVLLRAAIPLVGESQMRRLRGRPEKTSARLLMNGPGKLTQALGIDLSYNGATFNAPNFKLVDLGKSLKPAQIEASPRIGISKATEKLWRFTIKGSAWLSRRV